MILYWFNDPGYTALHHSAAWGHLECLKTLVSLGADHLLTTRHKETPRDVAVRYGKEECVSYLDAVGEYSDVLIIRLFVLEMCPHYYYVHVCDRLQNQLLWGNDLSLYIYTCKWRTETNKKSNSITPV